MSEESENSLSTPALDTGNSAVESISPQNLKTSTIELVQSLEGRVAAALQTLDEEDRNFATQLSKLTDKADSLKRSIQ